MKKTASSAYRVLLMVGTSVFISEMVVMIILAELQIVSIWAEAFIDSALLVLIISPFLYLFLFRPLELQIEVRKNAEEALKVEKDKAQSYLDVAGVILLILDTEGRVLLINKKGVEILGMDEADVKGKVWFDNFIPQSTRDEVRAAYGSAMRGQGRGLDYFENSILTATGSERLIAWRNTAITDDNGMVNAILSSGEDITDIRRADEALMHAHEELEQRVAERTSELTEANDRLEREFAEHRLLDQTIKETELKFRSVTQSANDAIVSADSRGKINFWNDGAERAFGYSEEEVLGKPLTVLMPERFREDHVIGIERVGRTGQSKLVGETIELSGLRKDGTEFPLELSIGMWTTIKGSFYSGIMRDITVRKRMEEDKENIQAQLVHSQKLEAIGRLIVGVAHDFSNIILSIKGYTKVTMKTLGQESSHYTNLNQIQQLVDRGSNITRQLLLFGRKQPVHFTVLDINDTIDGLLRLIDHLIRSDIKVEHELGDGLWKVKADKGNLEQVLMNLVVNANDAMPEGGTIRIVSENIEFSKKQARAIAEAHKGKYVCVKVIDTGFGMDKAVAERIFDPFFTTKGKEGSGLGLSVVYGVISRHGGWLDVTSDTGQGSAFTFCLPAISKKDEEEIKNGEL